MGNTIIRNFNRINMEPRRIKILKSIAKHIIVLIFAYLMIYPLVWMLISSFKTEVDIFSGNFFAKSYSLQNYITGWAGVSRVTFTTFYKNSFFLAGINIMGNVISCSITAFAFARIKFKLRNVWFAIMLLTMMLPSHVVTIPQYIFFARIGWVNSFLPLVIPKFFATDAFFIFLLVQFMRNIPREIDMAATVDGCNTIQLFYMIIFPLSIPAIVTTVLFTFINTWNEFFLPLLYLSNMRKFVISLGLRLFLDSQGQSAFGALFAMSILSLIPVFMIFVFFQKYLVEGITAGSIKG